MGGIITDIGQDQLECRLNVTGLVLLYTQAISWFVNVGLLPEQGEGPGNPFPVSQLERQYNDKRKRLAGLQGPFGRPGLMVDILCGDIGDDLICSFQKAGGTGSYPPPSLHSLITTFLSESPAPAKLRLVQYFFLDLAHLLPPDQFPDLVDSLIKFPSAFSLPPSVIKLTQAFWLLDHEDWEEAVSMMLDPLLQEDDLTPTHHRAILISLLAQSQPTLALKYTRIRRPPCMLPQDVSLHTSVLLANGAIQEAFTFQRSRRGSANSSNILAQFYRRAEELGKLDAVLQLSLTTNEEKEFVSFLQSSSRVDSQEVLLMYYLQRSRFTEAMQLNLSLKTLGKGGSSAREAIMDRYNHILPGLASTLGSRRITLTSAHGMGTRPVPLSVTLQDRNIRLNSHASAIEARLATPVNSRKENQFTPFRAKGRRGEERKGIVRPTDITQTSKRKADEEPTICYPNETFQDNSLLTSTKLNGTTLVSPPRKRTRLSDVSSLNMSVKSMRRMSRYMTAEAITILSTPTITRVRKAVPSYRVDPAAAPASILKVKQLIKDVPAAAEGDKILDVSLSLDDTPTIGSRDTTPTKSLRFREPKKFPSDLATEPAEAIVPDIPELSVDDSQLSNDTNDSFHSFTSGQMDVDSPIRANLDSPVSVAFKVDVDSNLASKSFVDSPLASKSFGGRPSIGTLSRGNIPVEVVEEEEEKVTSFSSHSITVSVTEEGKTIREETSRVESGITITSMSPSTKAELEEVMKKAETKLKEKENSVIVPKVKVAEEEEPATDKTVTGLLGAKELVLLLEGEDSQDSDIFMHGKSWERSVDTSDEKKEDKQSDTSEKEADDEDDYESEDDKYYDNKTFEKKECDIVLESSEDSKDSSVVGESIDKVSDEDKDSDAQGMSWQRKVEAEKSKEVPVFDESSKDCEVIVDTSEDEVDKPACNVEELEESDESDSEVKDLDYSWAPQGKVDKYEKSEIIAAEIKKLIAEETINSSVEIIEDALEESVVVEEVVFVDHVDTEEAESQENVHVPEEKSRISTIDLDESADEKVAFHLSFSTDTDDSMEVDEVIEIDSDEEQNEEDLTPAEPSNGKVLFSSLFSHSSHESDGELEVSNVEEVEIEEDVEKLEVSNVEEVEIEEDVENEPNEFEVDDLVIVEDGSNSTELFVEASESVAETGAVIFSTFGKEEKVETVETVIEEDKVESVVEEQPLIRESKVEENKVKDDLDAILEVSDDSVQEEYEEDPVYFEEANQFDIEADFFSPGAGVKKTLASATQSAYSYDVCTAEVNMDRKPTERKEEAEKSSRTEETNPMELVRRIIAEEETKEIKEKDELVLSEDKQEENDSLDSRGSPYRLVEKPLSMESPKSEAEDSVPEDDDMRDLLDRVSTTATRASSIAGSIFGENRAGSVSGSVFGDVPLGHGPTFSFSEPGHLEQGDQDQEVDEVSRFNYNFSMPLDSSQTEDIEVEDKSLKKEVDVTQQNVDVYDKLELRSRTVTETSALVADFGHGSTDPVFDAGQSNVEVDDDFEGKKDLKSSSNEDPEEQPEESEDSSVEDEEDQEAQESSDEGGEESEEGDNSSDESIESEKDDHAGGLEFSWTQIPPQSTANVSQLVNEEIKTSIFTPSAGTKSPFLFGKVESGYSKQLQQSNLLFSAPLIESEDQNIDLNDSQFGFGEPHDESMDMDAVENTEVEDKIQGIAKLDMPLESMTTTPVRATASMTPPVRRSTRKTPATRNKDSSQIEDTEAVDKMKSKKMAKMSDTTKQDVDVHDQLELRNRTVTETLSLVSDFGPSSAVKGDEQDQEADDSSDEEAKEGDESIESEEDDNARGLDFSWTKGPSQSTANIAQLVEDEIKDSANLVFSAPLVESEDQSVDLNDSRFEFVEPHDASMDMDALENIEADPKVQGIVKLDESDQKFVTPVKAEKSVTPVRRSTRKPSQTQDSETLTKSVTLPLEITPLKNSKSSKITPAKSTGKTPSKETSEKVTIPENVTASGRRRERPSRVASADDSISGKKAPSLASTEPMESDSEDRADQFASEKAVGESEQVPLAPPSSIKKRGRPKKEATTPVVDKTSTESTQSRVSKMDISASTSTNRERASSKASTVLMDTGSVSSETSAKLQKTTVTSELEDLAIVSTTTPATPIRRSRRISGVTPSMTPNIERSRRASGATTATPKKLATPAKKYDQLELRNRTVTETLSLVTDLGQNKIDSDMVDTLELRNRKVQSPQRKSKRRSSIQTPDGSPAGTSAGFKSSPAGPKSSPLPVSKESENMSTSPKDSPVRKTSRASKKEANKSLTGTDEETETVLPATPLKASALPKHLTPLKKVLTPKKDEAPLTPTRRSRRLSSGDLGSGEPLTPSRRSRRLSGAAETLDSAPDGGLITGTPRKTPSTPRSRRHTSVRPEDVETALAVAGAAPLPTLLEEEEREDSVEKEEIVQVQKRGRKSAKPSNPSLKIISEEDISGSQNVGLPDFTADETVFFPMKSRPKRKEDDQLTPDGPPKRRSRRVTITTLGTDVDLFTPVKATPASTSGTSRRESTGGVASKKKYVPVKKKTSVRIK
eukprot:GFUD01104869.1.p1 GENE.GFUD01104869.1~~GFUD01104869.1.p1  ORF type:complete len:2801 (+),score=928.21 GFUD01104869.1:744-8405(+)